MHKVEQLVIRACKSKDPNTRLRRVYDRFYLRSASDNLYRDAMVHVLANICDKHLDLTVIEVISGCQKDRLFPRADQPSFEERALNYLISKVRFTEVIKFEGLTHPIHFRNQHE